jgi:hypothetical protein
MVEPDREAAQSRVSHHFVPVIENGGERYFAPDDGERRAQQGGHTKQRDKASAKPDAAKRGKHDENDHSQTRADDYLDRLCFAVQIHVRNLGQWDRPLRKIIAADRYAKRVGHASHTWNACPGG